VAFAASLGLETVPRDRAVEAAQAFTSSRGFDVVLICADTSSNDPVELTGVIARDRARVVATGAVGLTLPRKIYYEKELSLINSRSYGPGRYDPSYEENGHDYPTGFVRWTEGRNFQAIVELLENGRLNVKPLITHRFPIEAAAEAYQVITGRKKTPFLGVLLTYAAAPASPSAKVEFHPLSVLGAPVRLGVLGAGLFANSTLLPAIKKIKAVELVAVASAGGLHARHSAQKFGFAYAASDDQQILEDAQINTVAILTRHDAHAGLVIRALQANKHVFVEKPLAVTPEQLDDIEKSLSLQTSRILTVGYNRRFAPLAAELANFLANRTEPLHAHYRINAGYIPLNHWTQDPQQGGGRIIGEGCHFVDFLTFLTGAAPATVTAHALPDNGKYHQDNLSMTFTFPDGSVGVVDYLASGDRSFPKERLEVFCAGRVAVLQDFRSLEMVLDGRRRLIRKPQDKGWINEWVAFARAIQSGGQPPIPYDQLIGVTRATFAAVDSLRTGTTVKLRAD
jgi:predicted dehydrogenase